VAETNKTWQGVIHPDHIQLDAPLGLPYGTRVELTFETKEDGSVHCSVRPLPSERDDRAATPKTES
jgi:hypothetical protein